jgi:hypothetical protein
MGFFSAPKGLTSPSAFAADYTRRSTACTFCSICLPRTRTLSTVKVAAHDMIHRAADALTPRASAGWREDVQSHPTC